MFRIGLGIICAGYATSKLITHYRTGYTKISSKPENTFFAETIIIPHDFIGMKAKEYIEKLLSN